MRKQLLLKMLLMTVGLFMGTSAMWADPTLVYGRAVTADLPNGYTAWSASDVAASGTDVWIGDFTYNETYGIYASGTGNRTSVMTFSHTENSLQTFDIVFDNLGNTGNASNYSYLRIGSAIEIQSNQQAQSGAVIINGVSNAITDCNQKNYNRGGDKWTIHVEINTAKKEVTALTIEGTPGTYGKTTKYAHYTLASTTSLGTSPTFNTVTIGFVRAGGTPAAALTSIKIQEEAQVVSMADYTINYKAGDDLVKTVSGSSAVSSVITAETAIDGTEEGFVGNHYLISAAEAPSMTLVAGENVLNVPVRAPYTATVRLTKNINGESSYVDYPFTETDAKDCSYAVGWPMYEKDGDNYYGLTEETDYAVLGSFTDGQTITKNVNYTTAAPDVVLFNDLNGSSVTNASYSSGSYTSTSSQLANVTVDAGVYDVIFNVVAKAGQGSNHRNAGVSVNGTNVANLSGNINGIRTLRIIVENDNSTLTAYGNGTSNWTDELDYVIVRKIIDGTTVSKNITAAGWATYCSPCALDLEHATGLTNAYIITGGENKIISKVSVKNGTVPANTGLLLEGVEGTVTTVTIPVVANSLTDVSANKLVGKTAKYGLPAEAGYVLMNEEDGLGFYMNRNDFYVGANTAYLPVGFDSNGGEGAPTFYSLFDGDVTGISATLVNSEKENSEIYNLAGQRVAAPTKGLYIVNGKKMVLK